MISQWEIESRRKDKAKSAVLAEYAATLGDFWKDVEGYHLIINNKKYSIRPIWGRTQYSDLRKIVMMALREQRPELFKKLAI